MNVLVPLDGSEASFKALRRGLEILKGHPTLRVVLFNVRQPGFEGASDAAVDQFDSDEDDEVFPTEASSLRMLGKAEEIAKEVGVPVERKVRTGIPIDTILDEAAAYDLVLIHELSKSNFRDMIRGSTSERLVRTAPVSVLVVRA